MAKNKLFRFAEMKKMDHVFEPTMDSINKDQIHYKGVWASEVFKNDNPVILELGCGKGEYTVALAEKCPEKNFIGIDIKGARMWVGAKECLEKNLTNAAFLRTKVDFIEKFFSPGEVEEIWLTFSDPQPAKPNKRLTSETFIERYKKILKPGGIVHLKTDSDILFEFTENEISTKGYKSKILTDDLYSNLDKIPENLKDILTVRTHYEELFSSRGHKIKYCQFEIH
ncbi:MAG: tRNA (guanosine(46)-N7)-methyltransferase TrmB [Brumimicrobium sp.]|nr:tRNA (guanosine(46)-N7)-methyltransferase TrmB [Brumimicrobium sp.]